MRKGGFDKFTMDDYTITEDGVVINNRWNRKLKPQPNNRGYLRVQLCGKFYFVHRLVAEKYVENPDNKLFVNHKDGDKRNNKASNLEWVTNAENRHHSMANGLHKSGERCPVSKLTKDNVEYIRQHADMPRKELAEMFGVSRQTITAVIVGRSWKNS